MHTPNTFPALAGPAMAPREGDEKLPHLTLPLSPL